MLPRARLKAGRVAKSSERAPKVWILQLGSKSACRLWSLFSAVFQIGGAVERSDVLCFRCRATLDHSRQQAVQIDWQGRDFWPLQGDSWSLAPSSLLPSKFKHLKTKQLLGVKPLS